MALWDKRWWRTPEAEVLDHKVEDAIAGIQNESRIYIW